MFKIHQARLQQYVNQKLPDVQAGFRKGRGTTRLLGSGLYWVNLTFLQRCCWAVMRESRARVTKYLGFLQKQRAP